jgi:hypothetical protein
MSQRRVTPPVHTQPRWKGVTALLEMKAHREKLLTRVLDTDHYSLALSRELCQQDLAANETASIGNKCGHFHDGEWFPGGILLAS